MFFCGLPGVQVGFGKQVVGPALLLRSPWVTLGFGHIGFMHLCGGAAKRRHVQRPGKDSCVEVPFWTPLDGEFGDFLRGNTCSDPSDECSFHFIPICPVWDVFRDSTLFWKSKWISIPWGP